MCDGVEYVEELGEQVEDAEVGALASVAHEAEHLFALGPATPPVLPLRAKVAVQVLKHKQKLRADER